MILMAFGMSLHGTKPMQNKSNLPAIWTVAALKNIVMPLIAFGIGLRHGLPRAHAVRLCRARRTAHRPERVQLAARYNVGMTFARDGILISTMTSPIVIAIIAALLS